MIQMRKPEVLVTDIKIMFRHRPHKKKHAMGATPFVQLTGRVKISGTRIQRNRYGKVLTHDLAKLFQHIKKRRFIRQIGQDGQITSLP